jgi:deoxyhypusine synthase
MSSNNNPLPVKSKAEYLDRPVIHYDMKSHSVLSAVDAMQHMAFSSRDLHRAADIYERMLKDRDCAVILCLAGSLISSGLKQIFVEMIRNNMVDAIVSTGANIVDQDFFEALGYKHYIAGEELKTGLYDNALRELNIDRIYDTLIDEDELRICDDTIRIIADDLERRPYSSREFIREMGAWLVRNGKTDIDGIVLECYKKDVPIFVPAFSDCSAGFGLVAHQAALADQAHLSIDSVRDFRELTQVKLEYADTGLFMIGGGVPKNFAQDIVVAADILGHDAAMHKYAVQITVADTRDGALSGSTLKEACSWGKVSTTWEQMVYSEATMALPLIAGYCFEKGAYKQRNAKQLSKAFDQAKVG